MHTLLISKIIIQSCACWSIQSHIMSYGRQHVSFYMTCFCLAGLGKAVFWKESIAVQLSEVHANIASPRFGWDTGKGENYLMSTCFLSVKDRGLVMLFPFLWNYHAICILLKKNYQISLLFGILSLPVIESAWFISHVTSLQSIYHV